MPKTVGEIPDQQSPRSLLKRARRKLQLEQWVIGIRRRRDGDLEFRLDDFAALVPSEDRFYADPFVIDRNGSSYLFFEELVFANNKGIISCTEIDETGHCHRTRPVLEMDYHLSYPFVFEWEGEMYMLPETHDSGQILLFRGLNFPDGWKLEQVLMDGVWAVDPTLFQHDGKFWLFAGGIKRNGAINSELYLFFSDTPFGPWNSHPLNPVVADVSRARPAGKVFVHNGHLIRPGQDCSLRYGSAIILNTIVELTETRYREEMLTKLDGSWLPGNLGSHTFNSSDRFQVIDGRRLVRRPVSQLISELARRSTLTTKQ